MGICSRDYRGALQPPPSLVPLPWLNNYLLWGPSGTPEIIIRYLTIVINHFRARWRVHFGYMLSFLLNFESPSSLPCAYSRCSLVSSSWSFCVFIFFLFSFLSFFHFVRTESRVGSIRSLKRGHVFEGMWFVLFEGIFYSKQLRRKWFPSRVGSFIPVYFIFSIDYFFSFFFYLLPCVPHFCYSSRSGTIIEKVEKVAS